MQDNAFTNAFYLIISFDPDMIEIIVLSLRVSLTALVIAIFIGLPLGAVLAMKPFFGRQAMIIAINALMGLPPVVAGLILYLLLSRNGALGPLELLYTPMAMILAQALLITPIIAALSRETLAGFYEEYREQFILFGLTPLASLTTLIWEARYPLITAILAGFGRAIAEIGAVLIVGGNINHLTRVMTTTIALETSRGNLAIALGLGLVLIGISVLINLALYFVAKTAKRAGYV